MKLLRSALVVTAAVVVPLLPTAAHADRYVHSDVAGDVASSVGSSTTFTPAPERVVGDVVSSMVNHKRRTVVLRLQYRDLANDSEYDEHVFFVHTSKMNRVVRLYASNAVPGGRAVMTKANGKKVACHVGRHIDYARNTATVIIPRSCLGQPRWVKAGLGGVMLAGLTQANTQWIDDALATGTNGSATYSPKVFR